MNQCPLCNGPTTIFWLHDFIWEQVIVSNPDAKDLTCIRCAEVAIGRPLTLRDLSIDNFGHTAKNMIFKPGVMREYVQAFVIGACEASNNQGYWPESWTNADDRLTQLGKKVGGYLAKNTSDICPILDELIQAADEFNC